MVRLISAFAGLGLLFLIPLQTATGQEGEAIYPPSTYAVQDTANSPPELV